MPLTPVLRSIYPISIQNIAPRKILHIEGWIVYSNATMRASGIAKKIGEGVNVGNRAFEKSQKKKLKKTCTKSGQSEKYWTRIKWKKWEYRAAELVAQLALKLVINNSLYNCVKKIVSQKIPQYICAKCPQFCSNGDSKPVLSCHHLVYQCFL